MRMYDQPQTIEKYLNTPLECSCGRTHFVPIKIAEVGNGVINNVPKYMKEFGYVKPYIVCDKNTYRVAGELCESILREAGYFPVVHILTHLNFDEATLGEIVINLPQNCDVMISCGTGTITDIIRYASYKLQLPNIMIPTGTPMDGFASSIGIVNVNNLKATLPAQCAEIILGDSEILKGAPYRMLVAGFGDLISKYTCLNDWKIAKIVNREHYCSNIVVLLESVVQSIADNSLKIKERDPKVIEEVMNGLILSGSTTSLYGDSRPVSGSEHHMSHFWEILGVQRGKAYAMHGEQVAVGTVLVLMLIEELLKVDVDFDKARTFVARHDFEVWKENIRTVYKDAAQEVINLEKKSKKNDISNSLRRVDDIQTKWGEIKSQLQSLPTSDYIKQLLTSVNCPSSPSEIGLSSDDLRKTLLYCKEVRPRYTILQLVWDLGLIDELSNRVINKLYEK